MYLWEENCMLFSLLDCFILLSFFLGIYVKLLLCQYLSIFEISIYQLVQERRWQHLVQQGNNVKGSDGGSPHMTSSSDLT